MPNDLLSSASRSENHRENNNNWHVYLCYRLATGSRWREHIITVLLGNIKTESHMEASTLPPTATFEMKNLSWYCLCAVSLCSLWVLKIDISGNVLRCWEKQKRAQEQGQAETGALGYKNISLKDTLSQHSASNCSLWEYVAIARPKACSPSFFN